MDGIGVNIHRLFGGSTFNLQGEFGKEIAEVKLDEERDRLCFRMADGTAFSLADEGQSCCESRYMRTDDKLDEFIGAKLLGAEVKEAPDIYDGGEVHEVRFLEIQTSKGCITFASHNEHNGYYGGFALEVKAGW